MRKSRSRRAGYRPLGLRVDQNTISGSRPSRTIGFQLGLRRTSPLPALVAATDELAQHRLLAFFAATIRNSYTRQAYSRAVAEFLAWCAASG